MDSIHGSGYRSASQIARRVTEQWAASNLYCAACSSPSIVSKPPNTPGIDFCCCRCAAVYQLKAMRSWNERSIPDGAYSSMMAALRSDTIPNLLLMHYTSEWHIRRLMLIPSFFFSTASIVKRKPLTSTAKRAGWVGCNILLSEIAAEGKILVVSESGSRPSRIVRDQYSALKPLSSLSPTLRGWTLDVWRAVKEMNQQTFRLDDIYNFEDRLTKRYPKNCNIRPKIRQQLQVLRELGLLEFRSPGLYRICVRSGSELDS